MKLSQSSKFNRNYSAKIVEVTEFVKHPNPKCERLKMVYVLLLKPITDMLKTYIQTSILRITGMRTL